MKHLLTLMLLIWYSLHCQSQEKPNIENSLNDSLAQNYKKGNVKLTYSNLPIVYINAGLRAANAGRDVRAHMGIINNEGELNHASDRWNDYDRKINLRYVGKDVFKFNKRSFLIETQRDNGDNFDVTIMNLPKENDFILYAPYSDKTLLRNALAHRMSQLAGYYSSRIAFCELKLNHRYYGVYALMEVIKKDKNRLDITDLNEDDTIGNKLTGGYILKIDEKPSFFKLGEHGWRSDGDFKDAMEITYQYVYPNAESIVPAQKNYIGNYMSDFEAALYSDNFADPNEGYNKFIDVGSFVDYMLINEVSKAVTAFNEGVYFYKTNITNGGKLHAGPLSDYTFGFNNSDYWNLGKRTDGFAHSDKWRVIYWWYRLMQDKYFYNLAYTRWLDLRTDKFSDDNLFAYIDSVATHIEGARIRNFEKWEILGKYIYPNAYIADNYTEEIQELKSWLTNRMAWMDNELFGIVLQPEVSIRNYKWGSDASRVAIKATLSDEYFNKSTLSADYFTIQGLPPGIFIDTIVYEKADEAIIVLSENASPITVTNELVLTVKPNVLNGFNSIESNGLILDINDVYNNANVNIYNRNKQLIIKSSRPELLPKYAEVYNSAGQKVLMLELNKQKVNELQLELNKNVYLVKVEMTNQIVTKRIVVL